VPVVPTGTFTDLHFPARPGGYDKFAWQIAPIVDPTPDGVFWSHQFSIEGSGGGGYCGLQTIASGINDRAAIFSIWNATGCDPGDDVYGRPIAQAFGGEGDGYQCLIAFPWQLGRAHAFTVERVVEGVWHAQVDDVAIGTIHVPRRWAGLAPTSVCWTERYAGPNRTCADLRHAGARFGSFVADDLVPIAARHHHLANPPGDCPSSIVDTGPGVLDDFEHHFGVASQ
jgi:hypothetical protein